MQTETMTLKDFNKLDINSNYQRLGYTKKFREFVDSQDEVLKFSLDSVKESRSCGGTIRNEIRKTGVNYKVVSRGSEVYVIKGV